MSKATWDGHQTGLQSAGSAGTAGREPSMDTVSCELVREIASGDFLFLCKAFWMVLGSEVRLASWWKTLRFRMMAYTKLQLPDQNIIRVGVGEEINGNYYLSDQKCLPNSRYCKSIYCKMNLLRLTWLKLNVKMKVIQCCCATASRVPIPARGPFLIPPPFLCPTLLPVNSKLSFHHKIKNAQKFENEIKSVDWGISSCCIRFIL